MSDQTDKNNHLERQPAPAPEGSVQRVFLLGSWDPIMDQLTIRTSAELIVLLEGTAYQVDGVQTNIPLNRSLEARLKFIGQAGGDIGDEIALVARDDGGEPFIALKITKLEDLQNAENENR